MEIKTKYKIDDPVYVIYEDEIIKGMIFQIRAEVNNKNELTISYSISPDIDPFNWLFYYYEILVFETYDDALKCLSDRI